jgi:hypothetical protein
VVGFPERAGRDRTGRPPVRFLLAAIAIAVLLIGVASAFDSHGIIRFALGTALVLWLPGYALTAALFPPGRLPGIERLLMAIGSSIALAIVVGFAFSGLGIPLTEWTWGGGLVDVALVAGAFVALRPTHRRIAFAWSSRHPLRFRDAMLFGLAALLVIGAIGVARLGASEQPQKGFTELSMVPAPGNVVRIGVGNEEATSMTYRVVLTSGSVAIATWQSVPLPPGQRWDAEISLPPNLSTGVQVMLYRADAPGEIYRRVALGPVTTPAP